jgi:hypothetical protein
MATTTNYSWTTPDDTDLVKDGAAAIRALGTAIDTTVYNNSLVSGLTLISTTTLSGATTTLSSIPQTYKSLYIVVTGMTGNTSDRRFRMLPNNVNNLSDYSLLEDATAKTFKSIEVRLTDADTSRTNANNAWAITIDNYTSSTAFKPFNYYGRWIDTAAAARTIFAGGVFCSTTAITSIVFDYQGINTFAGGTIRFYGVN